MFSRRMAGLLLYLLLHLSAQASEFRPETLIVQSQSQRLAADREWLMLGYYESKWTGGWKSRASESFFLSPQGNTDPQAELEATLRAWSSTTPRTYPALYGDPGTTDQQIPRCQFPARYRWLAHKLSVDESSLPPIHCDQLEKFRTRMGGQSASLVFSSYFLNSPSSSFGHSLLRISRNPPGTPSSERVELLDFGFGFAADANTSNPVVYAFSGIAGLFRGTYTNIPYYYKVREYNDFESRDLWSYELNLTPTELSMLVDRVWEMGSTTHAYYFFTFNCSNAILHALEVAAPRYRILEGLKYYVIPSDTIKRVSEVPGLVSRVTYRPSAYSVFRQRLLSMNDAEERSLHQTLQSKFKWNPDPSLTATEQVHVLDAAVDFLDYKYAKEIAQKNTDQKNNDKIESNSAPVLWRQELLTARAQIPQKSLARTDDPPRHQRPDLGHPSSRLGILGGHEKQVGPVTELSVRFALHDPLDPSVGYPAFSQIEMMGVRTRFLPDHQRFEIEDLNFFRVSAFTPLKKYQRSLSWRGEFGGKRIRDRNCDHCFGVVGEYGFGASLEPVNHFLFYLMLDSSFVFAPGFYASKVRLGSGPAVGAFLTSGAWGLELKSGYQYQVFSKYPHTTRMSIEGRYQVDSRWSVGVQAKVDTLDREWNGKIYYFF